MIDRCARDGCREYRVSQSRDSRPLLNRWFCSRACSEMVTKPVHWELPDYPASACGSMSTRPGREHRFTADASEVTCGSCKRSDAYKAALAAT